MYTHDIKMEDISRYDSLDHSIDEIYKQLRISSPQDRELDEMRDTLIDQVGEVTVKESKLVNEFSMEKLHGILDSKLEDLIKDQRNLSKFQIIDEMVECVSEILESRGITEFDQKDIEENVEKWIPRVSSKNETPPAFIKRVYGQIRGITMAAIQHIDPPLYKANRNWISRNNSVKDSPIPWKPDLGLSNAPTAYQGYNYRRVLAFKNKKYA